MTTKDAPVMDDSDGTAEKDQAKEEEVPASEEAQPAKRPLGTKEVIPFEWKLVGSASGLTLTLFKSVERADVDAQFDRLQKDGYYGNLRIVGNKEVIKQSKKAKSIVHGIVVDKTDAPKVPAGDIPKSTPVLLGTRKSASKKEKEAAKKSAKSAKAAAKKSATKKSATKKAPAKKAPAKKKAASKSAKKSAAKKAPAKKAKAKKTKKTAKSRKAATAKTKATKKKKTAAKKTAARKSTKKTAKKKAKKRK